MDNRELDHIFVFATLADVIKVDMARSSNSIEIYNTHPPPSSVRIHNENRVLSSVLFVCLLNDKISRRKREEEEKSITVAQDKLRLSIDSVGSIGQTHDRTQSRPSLLSSISIFRDFLNSFLRLVQRNPRHSASFFFLLSTGHIRIENQSSGYMMGKRKEGGSNINIATFIIGPIFSGLQPIV